MRKFITFIAVVLLAAGIIVFIKYPTDIPVHITIGFAFLVAIFGIFKMKNMENVHSHHH